MQGFWIWVVVAVPVLAIIGILMYFSKTRRNLLRLRIDLDKRWGGVVGLLEQKDEGLPKGI